MDVKTHDTNQRFDVKVSVSLRHSAASVCDPMDCNPPDSSSVHGILQARILEWVAIPFSNSGIKPRSPALQADSLPLSNMGSPMEPIRISKRPGKQEMFHMGGQRINTHLGCQPV